MESILHSFPISPEEYLLLDEKFGKLAYFAAWELKRKNSKNANFNDPDDDVQELRIALMRAGSYYKRQTYIEDCFQVLELYATDRFIKRVVLELKDLWENRRRHGANRQKFGPFQEVILDRLVENHVPLSARPDRKRKLQIDLKFTTYCKKILWNEQKSLGKQITREKGWRTGLVSLSEFDYLAHESRGETDMF